MAATTGPGTELWPDDREILVFVKTLAGKTIPITIKLNSTIRYLKSKIDELEGIPPNRQSIICGGQQLTDDVVVSQSDFHRMACGLMLGVRTACQEPFNVFVQTADGKTTPIQADPGDCVSDLKAKLEEAGNLPKEDQQLIFEGRHLQDHWPLDTYNESVVHLVTICTPTDSSMRMKIFVRQLTGQTISLDVSPDETIESIKEKISLQDGGFPPEKQQLVSSGRPLENSHTLGFYDIQKESVIHLVLRARVSD